MGQSTNTLITGEQQMAFRIHADFMAGNGTPTGDDSWVVEP
jgi:hypothetical protein